MTFAWHDHHFINRHPALDFANTVVYRHFLVRRDDRIKDLKAIEAWRRASGFQLRRGQSSGGFRQILEVRETIDGFFRHIFIHRTPERKLGLELVRLYARHVPMETLEITEAGLSRSRAAHPEFLGGILQSAVELAFSSDLLRVKVCPSCGWLFIDRTRNGRKRWCITAMCGNRSKARRHYERRRRANLRSP